MNSIGENSIGEAMKIEQVKVGAYYLAKVSKRRVPVFVLGIDWTAKRRKIVCRSMFSDRKIFCTAKRLLQELSYEQANEVLHQLKYGGNENGTSTV